MPGHVVNRLQAALWREAIHLVNEGVASVADVDIAVSSGPGLCWVTLGPTGNFHLGADHGLAQLCEHYTDSFNRRWDDLGTTHLDADTVERLVEGMREVPTPPPTLSSSSGVRRAQRRRRRDAPRGPVAPVSVSGCVALVVGGRDGSGRAVTKRLVREGAEVFAADVTAVPEQEGVDGARHLVLDVTAEADVARVVDEVGRAAGRLDVLVNAAAVELEKTIEDTSRDEWQLSFAVNVTGTFLVVKHALPLLRVGEAPYPVAVIQTNVLQHENADVQERIRPSRDRELLIELTAANPS